jgi:hypothetical protein
MGIKREFQFDLNPETNAALCRMLCGGDQEGQFHSCPVDPPGLVLQDEKDMSVLIDMTDAKGNPLPSVTCVSYEIEKFEVLDDRGFRVTHIEVVTPKLADVALGAKARLFIDPAATADQEKAVLAAWNGFKPGDDLDDLEDQLTLAGVPRRTYVVDLCARYSVSNIRVDDQRRTFALNEAKRLLWTLNTLGTRCGCKAPALELAPDEKRYEGEPPTPDQLEPNRPRGCEQWNTGKVDVKKGQFNGLPDLRVVMVATVIEVKRCLRIIVDLPQLQIRDVETEIHAYVVLPEPTLKQVEKAVIKCIDDAAVSAAIVLLISGGNFPAAGVAFEVAMKACLTYTISDEVAPCVKPGLYLQEVRKPWRPAT